MCQQHTIFFNSSRCSSAYRYWRKWYRQTQRIELVSSVVATRFGPVDHPQTLKCIILKNTSKNACRYKEHVRFNKFCSLLQTLCSIELLRFIYFLVVLIGLMSILLLLKSVKILIPSKLRSPLIHQTTKHSK